MSDDLVKRLREEAAADTSTCSKLTEEAADRIEQLEAALREIVEQIEQYDLPAPVVTLFVLQKARKALDGKDD